MMKALITGAGGFIGKELSGALLHHGVEVHGFERTATKKNHLKNLHVGDISNKNEVVTAVAHVQPDWVFHLAADTRRSRDPLVVEELYRTNVEGALNLLEASRTNNVGAFVAVGSFEEYGDSETPFRETMAPRPRSPYGITKAAASLLVTGYSGMGLKAAVVRFPVVYGPGQHGDSFLGGLFEALRLKKEFPMTSGEQTRDFLFVSDAAEALIMAARNIETCQGEIMNACTGRAISLKEASVIASGVAGISGLVRVGSLPYRTNEQMVYVGSPEKIEQLTGWKPRVAFTEGLEKTWKTWTNTAKVPPSLS